jgi:hypothetical protein
VKLTLAAFDTRSETLLSTATLDRVDPALVRGGIALASSESSSAPGGTILAHVVAGIGPGCHVTSRSWLRADRRNPVHGLRLGAEDDRAARLAVANPKVTFADYRKGYPTGQGLGDQTLKREGYGIVRVDIRAAEFVLECWP